jgi:uncharacterized damage-inducible protein DinB
MKQLYDYHFWANERMLEHLALYPEIFTRPAAGPFPSIGRTFEHIYDVDRLWFSRMKKAGGTAGTETHFTTAMEAKKAFANLQKEVSDFLLTEPDGHKIIKYQDKKGVSFENTLTELITHIVNHGTSHRGNVAVMLHQAGYGSCPTDFIYFLRDNKSGTRI